MFLGTILQRKEPHIYVANWFYLAFIVTIAMLHVVNNLGVPVSFFGTKSYSLFSGVQDALTQWWYGHNAVGFFLTAGFLGMMYYFVPKQAGPAGLFLPAVDHPLLVADLPLHLGRPAPPALHGAARLGADAGHDLLDHAVDAVLGRHDQRPDDPVGRLGQAAHRPGPALHGGRRSPSTAWHLRRSADVDPGGQRAQSHYTDWTIGHVHSGALGWVAFITFGAVYYLVPRLWKTQRLYSLRLVSWHFWIATIGIVLYITAMWVSGIMQGLMWRAYDDAGFLQLLVRRDGRGHASLLRHPRARRRPVPRRRPDHGLQPVAHDHAGDVQVEEEPVRPDAHARRSPAE